MFLIWKPFFYNEKAISRCLHPFTICWMKSDNFDWFLSKAIQHLLTLISCPKCYINWPMVTAETAGFLSHLINIWEFLDKNVILSKAEQKLKKSWWNLGSILCLVMAQFFGGIRFFFFIITKCKNLYFYSDNQHLFTVSELK